MAQTEFRGDVSASCSWWDTRSLELPGVPGVVSALAGFSPKDLPETSELLPAFFPRLELQNRKNRTTVSLCSHCCMDIREEVKMMPSK